MLGVSIRAPPGSESRLPGVAVSLRIDARRGSLKCSYAALLFRERIHGEIDLRRIDALSVPFSEAAP
jgi:hypothetical protein